MLRFGVEDPLGDHIKGVVVVLPFREVWEVGLVDVLHIPDVACVDYSKKEGFGRDGAPNFIS
ncbi:hypothetical protein Scep_018558 [Stephania cephalantha]|uniref:Uncharacterized protein n=1 Tax=Stephania cephalantha TaxID=152367 RepID=A0AAP0NLY4_9MAGN